MRLESAEPFTDGHVFWIGRDKGDDEIHAANMRDDSRTRLKILERFSFFAREKFISVHKHDDGITEFFGFCDAGEVSRVDGIKPSGGADDCPEFLASGVEFVESDDRGGGGVVHRC